MSKEVTDLHVRVESKKYGEFEFPLTVELDQEDPEDWYREVYYRSTDPARERLDALGYSEQSDETRSATVSILNEDDIVLWAYEVSKSSGYESLGHVTIPDLVAYNPNLPPKRLRNA